MVTVDHTPHQRLLQTTPGVRWLAVVWLEVALVQATIATPADMLGWLGFSATQLGHAWWTLFTYGAVHGAGIMLGLSLFTLLVFGPRVEQAWGTRTFLLYTAWCTAGGALTHAVFVHQGILEGGASSMFGLMLAYAWLWPHDELALFGVLPLRVQTLMGALIGAMLVAGVTGGSMSGWGYLAQLGGFLFGALYLKRPTPVSIDELRHRMSPAPEPTDEPPRAIPRSSMPRSRHADEVDEIVAQSNAAVANRTVHAPPETTPHEGRREALNRVLDKISRQGIEALSPEDRSLLEEISRRLRRRGR